MLFAVVSLAIPFVAAQENEGESRPVKVNITFTKGVYTKDAAEGETVEGRLDEPLMLDDEVIAPRGSTIYGSIEHLIPSRRLLASIASNKRKFKRHSSLWIKFEKIVTPDKEEIFINGRACEQDTIFTNGTTARTIKVGPEGELLKTGDLDMLANMDFGLVIPKSWVTVRGYFQVDIQPEDQLIVETTVPYKTTVSAQIAKRNKSGTN